MPSLIVAHSTCAMEETLYLINIGVAYLSPHYIRPALKYDSMAYLRSVVPLS